MILFQSSYDRHKELYQQKICACLTKLSNVGLIIGEVRNTYPRERIFPALYPVADNEKAPSTGEVARLFNYHKSMELTGLSYRVKQQRATSTVENHIPSFLKSK